MLVNVNTGGVLKLPEPKLKHKIVGENNGQLRLVRHYGWRTQARLDQKNIVG